MTEQKIQTRIIKGLEQEGYLVLKLIRLNKNGYPDLLAVKKNKTIFVEVKRPNGELSALQEARIKELNDKGIEAVVWCDYNKNF